MSKWFIVSLLTVGLSIPAFSAPSSDLSPVSDKGFLGVPEFSGASTCEITNSTSTTALLCDTGAGIILGVHGSSVAATDQIVFRDSATANTSSTRLLTTDITDLLRPGQGLPRYKNGLSVNCLVAPTAAGTTSRPAWTIVYKALD